MEHEQDSFISSVDPSKDLAQGDVLYWKDSDDPMLRAGVVVTADCDLAKGKHWGRVSIVPLVAVEDYVEEIYCPRHIAEIEPHLFLEFGKAVHRVLKTGVDGPPGDDALHQLIGAENLPGAMKTHQKLESLHSIIRQCRGLSRKMSNADLLTAALIARNSATRNLTAERVLDFLNSPPGDCLLLPEIVGLPGKLQVAFLRVLREIGDVQIARKTSQLSPGMGQRVGRLDPVIRYRLTQKLAQVFSDIGLPESFETRVKDGSSSYMSALRLPRQKDSQV